MALQINQANREMLKGLIAEVLNQAPMARSAVDFVCDSRAAGMNTLGVNKGVPYSAATSTGPNGSPTGGGCGCGGATPVPGGSVPSGACGLPGPVPASASRDIGRWNCQTVQLNLAPCDIQRIEREQKLVTFNGTLPGLIPAGSNIGVELIPVNVSHLLCLELLRVQIETGGVFTDVAIGQVNLQPERTVQAPQGNYSQAWDYSDPERPDYTKVTDARCACIELCVCLSSQGHARFSFILPVGVPAGSNLVVELWGRRKNWLVECGPCPPCDQCDRVALTAAELAIAADTLYVIP